MRTENKPTRTYPGTAAKVMIVIFSILLTVSLIPAIINFSINQTLFKSDFYTKVLTKTNFYDQVPMLITDTVMTAGSTMMKGGLLSGLDQAQFEWMMTSMLPPGWIENQTNAALASVLDFMNLKTDSLNILIDLQPVKNYLLSSEGKSSLLNLLENLPACSEVQLIQIMIAMQSGQGGFALCHPPSSDLFNMDIMLDPIIYSFSSSLPSAIAIIPANQPGIIRDVVNSPVFIIYRNLRILMDYFPWVCLILAFFILLISLRSPRWMTTALGLPLIFAGLVCSIPGVWLYLSGGQDFSGMFAGYGLGSLQGIEALLVEVFQEGLQAAGHDLLVWNMGAIALGLVFISIRLLAKK